MFSFLKKRHFGIDSAHPRKPKHYYSKQFFYDMWNLMEKMNRGETLTTDDLKKVNKFRKLVEKREKYLKDDCHCPLCSLYSLHFETFPPFHVVRRIIMPWLCKADSLKN
jgi:hypothetical protein